MLAELRAKSQITIPKNIINELDLKEGDKFEIFVEEGVIHLVPVVVYPKKFIDELNIDLENMKKNKK